MTFILQTVTLPSLRVASVFLVALFFYDVFMVFITPLFMPRGDSVMVRVATGGDTHEVRNSRRLVTKSVVLYCSHLTPSVHADLAHAASGT